MIYHCSKKVYPKSDKKFKQGACVDVPKWYQSRCFINKMFETEPYINCLTTLHTHTAFFSIFLRPVLRFFFLSRLWTMLLLKQVDFSGPQDLFSCYSGLLVTIKWLSTDTSLGPAHAHNRLVCAAPLVAACTPAHCAGKKPQFIRHNDLPLILIIDTTLECFGETLISPRAHPLIVAF